MLVVQYEQLVDEDEEKEELLLGAEISHQPGSPPHFHALRLLQDDVGLGGIFQMQILRRHLGRRARRASAGRARWSYLSQQNDSITPSSMRKTHHITSHNLAGRAGTAGRCVP